MNWVDTPLLVYGGVFGHPARATVEETLRRETWASSVLVLLEFYLVLTRVYAVAPHEAVEQAELLARSAIHWTALDVTEVVAALAMQQRYHLESADAVLLRLAQQDHGTLVTQDRRLLRAAEAEGVAVRNPITPGLAATIDRWEEQHLPAKGLSRMLGRVERWLRAEDAAVADRFVLATAELTTLPP